MKHGGHAALDMPDRFNPVAVFEALAHDTRLAGFACSSVPHLPFAVFLWALCRLAFRQTRATAVGQG